MFKEYEYDLNTPDYSRGQAVTNVFKRTPNENV